MMKNWFNKLLGKDAAPKRKKVQINLNYEAHSFKLQDLDTEVVEDLNKQDARLSQEKLTK
ncbi:hypothetical protein [Shewanella maritima]|uniref:hypothetical protein n=1 Tax=Shewanella maritima TaxID=2520507 RepID=UPI0037350F89